jgi:GNAT superfamily N-acetyltransferase
MLLAWLDVNGEAWLVRRARRDDVAAIVALLSDDVLGQHREAAGEDLAPYLRAFDLIAASPNQELIVVERDGGIVATLDLAVLPSLSRRGAVRMQVEAVRVASSVRGSGLGSAVFRWIVEHARRSGCDLVQLTSDRARVDAHAFYERLGFAGSHVGFKLDLRATEP